jgi:Putative transposase/Transposase zinc-binding domain
MILLSQLITEYEHDLLDLYGHRLLPSHLKALGTMKYCRTEGSLLLLAQCEKCHYQAFYPHSCGHRSCPHCQHHESQQWLERQRAKLLPVDYFMITFTLPAQLRMLAWYNQKVVYALLFEIAWETLRQFGLKDKKLLGTIGATAVLHTNTRSLNYHPHVHFIMPAGAVNQKQSLWRKKTGEFLFYHKNLAKVFHAKWIDALKKKALSVSETIPDDWVVECTHVGQGDKALTYLGQYLYRGILPEKNIIQNRDGKVTFTYTDNTKIRRTRTLPGADFLWLLLQHVLPRGFRRARDFGFLHANCKRMIQFLQYVLRCFVPPKANALSKRAVFLCDKCGGVMKIIATRIERKRDILPCLVDT